MLKKLVIKNEINEITEGLFKAYTHLQYKPLHDRQIANLNSLYEPGESLRTSDIKRRLL